MSVSRTEVSSTTAEKMFESRTSASAAEKLPDSGKRSRVVLRHGKDTQRNAANKNMEQCMKSPRLLLTITSSRRESWTQWENCQKFALKIN